MESLQLGLHRRVPLVLQTEAAECGLACLAMVAGFHGHSTDLSALRARFSLSLKGATLANVADMAEGLGLAGRPLQLELDELRELRTPCILHWDLNHFVVLVQAGPRDIVVNDPARGRRRLRYEEASKHFTGVALELAPADGFVRAREASKVRLRELLGRVSGLGAFVAQILVLAACLELVALLSPFYMQTVVDAALVSADHDLLKVLALGFGLLAVVQAGISLMRSWVVLYLGTTVNVQWLGNVFTHLLHLPVTFFEKRHMGDVVSRFGAVSAIQQTLTTNFLEAIVDGLMAVAVLAMMVYYSGTLSAVSIVAVVLYGALRFLSYGPLRRSSEEYVVHASKQQSTLIESVRGIQSLRLFGREAQRRTRWLNQLADSTNRALVTQRLLIGTKGANTLLFGVENVLVVYVGAGLVLDGGFSVGMLFAYIAYKSTFTARVGSLIDKLFELRMLDVQAVRLADIVHHEREGGEGPAAPGVAIGDASLEVRGLGFQYADTEPSVIRDCSFRIEAGDCVAIVGASGCGKTTLVKLMLGLLPPSQGEVRVGGVGIRQFGLRRYREMVASVMQEDQLFAGSIADNISFFDARPDQELIEESAGLAAVHEEIMRMPMGYNTLIGDMGAAISGGQKQRILLARALYRRPRILFLDEATSHLDIANERAVNQAMKRLAMTRVIVAHRPETIAMANRVIVLQKGAVAQDLRHLDGKPGLEAQPR